VKSADVVVAVETAHRSRTRLPAVYRREWPIGVGQTRVDLAVIGRHITAFEVKAWGDDLARLPQQVKLYSAVADRAVLVVERTSLLGRALASVPVWWGVWHTTAEVGGPRFRTLRAQAPNPTPEPLATAQLLWRDEALQLLDAHGLAVGLRSATRWRLWQRLADSVPPRLLRREVCAAIRARPGW